MHETALARDIITIVSETLQAHPANRVKMVRISIGEMIAVVPELLSHAYDSLIADTPLQQSKLELTIVPIAAACRQCGRSFGLHEFEFCCPHCRSTDVELTAGNEFFIKELLVE